MDPSGFFSEEGDTYVANTADNNSGFGFSANCPSNYLGNTAQANTTGQFANNVTSDSNLQNNLGF